MSKKLIYSKRFLQPDIEEVIQAESEELKKDLKIYEDFVHKMRNESVFVPNPAKRKKADAFIEAARRLSIEKEMDMDIYEYTEFVSAVLFLDFSIFGNSPKRMIAELFDMCDVFSFSDCPDEDFDMSICFSVYTHDHYLAGQKCGDCGDGDYEDDYYEEDGGCVKESGI